MNTAIVFVKEPVPGRVKTRLCPPLSHAQAASLYAAFARDTLAVLSQAQGARVEIAYDARSASGSPAWLGPAAADWFPQHGADLGERMNAAFERAFAQGAQRVITIGSDIPDLDSGLVVAAFQALEGRSLVLGPAYDGGYYLVGLSQPCPELFRSMAWSTPDVLEQTVVRAKRLGLPLELLQSRRDIDTAEDLAELRERLKNNPHGAHYTRQILAQIKPTSGKKTPA